MAVPISVGVLPGGTQRKAFVAAVAERYGLNPADYLEMQQRPIDGDMQIAFRPVRLPALLQTATHAVLRMVQDPVRGDVIRAAVPDFAATVQKLLDQITNTVPVTILVQQHEIDPLIRKYKYGPYPNINPRADRPA